MAASDCQKFRLSMNSEITEKFFTKEYFQLFVRYCTDDYSTLRREKTECFNLWWQISI